MTSGKLHQRGVTLIELMLVLVVIGILASFAIPRILKTAARAQRTEMVTMLEKMRVHFINAYRNNGKFPGPDPSAIDGTSAFNPPNDDPAMLGRPMTWISSRLGWSTYSFPPDGSVKMRYLYTVADGGQTLLLHAEGTLPGFDGVYNYTEKYEGESLTAGYPIELPSEL